MTIFYLSHLLWSIFHTSWCTKCIPVVELYVEDVSIYRCAHRIYVCIRSCIFNACLHRELHTKDMASHGIIDGVYFCILHWMQSIFPHTELYTEYISIYGKGAQCTLHAECIQNTYPYVELYTGDISVYVTACGTYFLI